MWKTIGMTVSKKKMKILWRTSGMLKSLQKDTGVWSISMVWNKMIVIEKNTIKPIFQRYAQHFTEMLLSAIKQCLIASTAETANMHFHIS